MPPPKAFVEDRMIASAAALGLVARRYSKQLNISFCFALLYLEKSSVEKLFFARSSLGYHSSSITSK